MIYVFTDLDETLLNSESKLTQTTIDAIAELRNAGHQLIPVTGAPYSIQRPRILGANIDYMISSNGGAIYDVRANKPIFELPLDPQTIRELWQVMKPHIETANLHCGIVHRRVFNEQELEQVITTHTVTQVEPNGMDFEKMKALESALQPFMKQKRLRVANRSKIFCDPKFVRGPTKWFGYDIVNDCTNKGEGIRRFCKLMNVNPKNTVAIGDGLNDVLMFDAVQTKVAMGNSLQYVKDLADHVTDDNDNDGVAKYIKWGILGI